MKYVLIASCWSGHLNNELIQEGCFPYLFEAKHLPLGSQVDCALGGCLGKWILISSDDASHALPESLKAANAK